MLRSMTGFAASKGELGRYSWAWELRSVNGKGLDMRLRVPDWLEGLEPALRAELGKAAARGNVTLNLRVTRSDGSNRMVVNPDALDTALAAIADIETRAEARGVTLGPTRASDLLSVSGVLVHESDAEDHAPLIRQLKSEFANLLQGFDAMRDDEGRALTAVLASQLDQVATLTEEAAERAEARKQAMADGLQANLARVLGNADGADPDRVAQELAILVVKADVTEEIDRLRAHVDAARALIAGGGPAGRKLDFLMQEFNREANTLCSKAQSTALTEVGLELKALIDQMREQVQNVE
ncbi:YicC/YloC family endoribonuclease [Chachezhania antarctica]|uniref:YicC/YloC family endoribonuclease n=1 Tax=Chachezhania antarctica TaxID=2340860 RepID=UPI000EB48478|nr:YicC/YloC family endoribonuclease [Chachezhania antarctica]